MMALLAASLRRGHSGVRVEVVELLLAMLDARRRPADPEPRLGRLLAATSRRSPISRSC